MVSLFLYLLLITISLLFKVTASDYCLWNRHSTNGLLDSPQSNVKNMNYLNGEYTRSYLQGTLFNNKPYFYHECFGNNVVVYCFVEQVYLYWSSLQNQWMISTALGDSFSDSVAYCINSTLNIYGTASDPNDCVEWMVNNGGNDYISDKNLTIKAGGCPESTCKELQFKVESNSSVINWCDGNYTNRLTTNLYNYYDTTIQKDKYLYFNPLLFMWICSNDINYDCNYAVSNVAKKWFIPTEWKQLKNNEKQYLSARGSIYKYYIKCMGGEFNTPRPTDTPQPTNMPTVSTNIPTSQLITSTSIATSIINEQYTNIPTNTPIPQQTLDIDDITTTADSANPLFVGTIIMTNFVVYLLVFLF